MAGWDTIWTKTKEASGFLQENPVITLAGLGVAGGLYDLIVPNRAREIQMEVIQGQREFRDDLARRARGNFSPTELQEITQASAPTVNRVAGNVAQRGLGGSGAGLQEIRQAQQAPFQQAQQSAMDALPEVNLMLYRMSAELANDGSFQDDIGAIANAFTLLSGDGDKDLRRDVDLLFRIMMGETTTPTESDLPVEGRRTTPQPIKQGWL